MKLAAVTYEHAEGLAVDEFMRTLAFGLRDCGLKLAGAVQTNEPHPGSCRCDMVLEDLATCQRIAASEHRGPLARGCRLDTSALEQSVGLALSSLSSKTDLVLINRFGKREAEGQGFRPLIAQAVDLQIPVIVGLNQAHADSWQVFSGGQGMRLTPTEREVMAWIEATATRSASEKFQTARSASASLLSRPWPEL